MKFYGFLVGEVTRACTHLTEDEAEVLKAYYHNLVQHPSRVPYYRHNWVRRMTGIAAEILTSDRDLEILDAGCGAGTEALFLASLRAGVRVSAFDCHWPSLRTAQKRKAYYENLLNRQLQVSFHNGDVLSISSDKTFDLVWAMEAISHIHPAQTFFERLPQLVRRGGLIGISDSNRLNPVMLLTVFRLRRKGLYLLDTVLHETGQVVKIAQEFLLTPRAAERKLISLGFRIKARSLGGFFPPIVGDLPLIAGRLNGLENVCQKIPGLAALGGIYTFVAEKLTSDSVDVRDCRSG